MFRYDKVPAGAIPQLWKCHICASLVADTVAHDHWHAQLIRVEHEPPRRRWRWA